jgi:endonuclease/exonuclease/phosphatase family metal-dependent hydrolase
MSKLSIASWNMSYWTRNASHHRAWEYLQRLGVHIALVQEAVPPTDVRAVYRAEGIAGKGVWGSAVASFGPEIRPRTTAKSVHNSVASDLLCTQPGSVAIADLVLPGQSPLVLVSLYGAFEQRYSITTVHRILSDLTPLFDSRHYKKIIVAGDLNSSTQLPSPDRERHRNLFERIESFGLVDLLKRTADERERLADCPCEDIPCTHLQTHRHSKSRVPWQDDYIFASEPLADKLVGCHAVDGGDTNPWSFSDHCPLVAILDIEVS